MVTRVGTTDLGGGRRCHLSESQEAGAREALIKSRDLSSGAKVPFILPAFSARLKPCPFKTATGSDFPYLIRGSLEAGGQELFYAG